MLSKKHKSYPRKLKDLQRLIDCIVVALLLLVITFAYTGSCDWQYLVLALLSSILTMVGFKSTQVYDSSRGDSFQSEVGGLIGGWGLVLGSIFFLGYVTKTSGEYSRAVVLTWSVLTPATIYSMHLVSRLMLRRLYAAGYQRRTAIIAGLSDLGLRLAKRLQNDPYLGIEFCGFFDDGPASYGSAMELLGPLSDLPDYVRRYHVDIVYIAVPMKRETEVMNLIAALGDTTASVYFAPNLFVSDLIQAKAHDLNGIPLLALWESPFDPLYALKRPIDILLASTILLLTSPIMIVVSALIKLTSPGPIFFKQRRHGHNGKEFVIYKFRTMNVMEDGHKVPQAQRDDPRVTWFGRFLRRSSLDELPQLINVIQGRMSLVGPRPHAVTHNEYYRKVISGYMLRHKVRPGITGLAQINGCRGETSTLEKMQQRVEYDLEYLQNWSLALDVKIILKTVMLMVKDSQAY